MSTGTDTRDLRAEALLLMGALIWAANYPVAKYGISRIDIFVFNALRFVVAAALLAVLVRARGRPWIVVSRADWLRLLRAGFVANVLYQIAFIVGLNLTTAGNSAVLLATAPLWTVVINARLHRESIRRELWVGMSIALAGIAMIVVGSGKKLVLGESDIFGDLTCMAAAFLWAFNTNLQKPLLGRYSPLQLTLMMVVIGSLGLSLAALPAAARMEWSGVGWTYYASAAFSGALSIAVGNLAWSYGVKRIGPGRTGNFGNVIPVAALVIAYFTLGETLTPLQLIGAAVTIIGVWYARR